MDAERFDRIARTLAVPASRRGGFRLLGGGSLAAVLARFGREEAAATHDGCRHLGVRCTKSGQCCSDRCKKKPGKRRGVCACQAGEVADKGACIPRVTCANNDPCNTATTGKVCTNGVCKCPEGEGDCADQNRCGSLLDNPNYCGACDVECPEGASCVNGICECPADRPKVCGGVCKACCDPVTDCAGGECDADGTCTCPSTVPVCNGTCCTTGNACLGTECGACPQGSDYCDFTQCGDNCICATDDRTDNPGCFDVSNGHKCASSCLECEFSPFGTCVRADRECCSSGLACVGEPCAAG